MRKKIVAFLTVLTLLFTAISFRTADYSIKANAAADPDINGNLYYYIKNVRSGKYLTCQHDSTASGTQIIQYIYTGHSSQVWKFDYWGDTSIFAGTYRILPVDDLNMAIQMQTAQNQNGILAKLAAKANDTKQFFRVLNPGGGVKRFSSNGSNFTKVLRSNNGSVYNNTTVLQYSTVSDGSDLWLLEPASYNMSNGYTYAINNFADRIMTYPNFFNYSDLTTKLVYDQTNYVSQCMCASGYHYRKNSNIWRCNKKEFSQPSSFDYNSLISNWEISPSWYNTVDFTSSWTNVGNASQVYSYNDIVNNLPSSYNNNPDVNPQIGGMVVIVSKSGGYTYPRFAGYVYNTSSVRSDTVLMYHIQSNALGKTNTLLEAVNECKNYYNLSASTMRIYIINVY